MARRRIASVLGWMVLSLLVLPGVASSAPPTTAIRYFYDAEGRLKGVYSPASETALYGWDAAGNLLSVGRKSSSVLSITESSPEQGAVGETVTIYGTGFSTTTSNDTVKFNGTAAVVTAATAWSLTTKVPTGATTGTVTVKTLTEGPVTSAQTFTVVAVSGAPHVASLSASVATAGSTVTINGSNFATSTAGNVVMVNQTRALVTSATSTALQVTVPGATVGGHVVVETALGSVTGPDLFIPPPEVGVSKVSSTGRLTLGSSITPNIATSGKAALVLFDGTAGQRVSFVLSSSTIRSGQMTVWGPRNLRVGGSVETVFGEGETMVDPIVLPTSGTYSILVEPAGTYTGSVKINGYAVNDQAGSLVPSTEGAVKEVSLTTPGQRAVYTVAGTAGEIVSATTASTSFTSTYTLEWYSPQGQRLAEQGYNGTENGFFAAYKFPSNGNYTLVVNPHGAATGTTTLRAYNAANVTGSISPSEAGESKPVSIAVPGQKATITFTGTAGERVSFVPSEVTIAGGAVSLLNPEGVQIGGSEAALGAGEVHVMEPVTLSTNGTYTVYISPSGADVGSLKLTGYKVVDQTGSLTPTAEGVSAAVSLPAAGQRAIYSIHGPAGEPVSLVTSSTSFTERFYDLEWYNEGGTKLNENGFNATENAFVEPFALPSTGTDSVVVNPINASTGSTTLTAYNASNLTGTITPTTEGESKVETITTPGQNGAITFAATAEHTVTIKSKESTIASGAIAVYSPEGQRVSNEESLTSASMEVTPAVSGTYTIFFNPERANTGHLKLTAYLGSHPGLARIRPEGTALSAEGTALLARLPQSPPTSPQSADGPSGAPTIAVDLVSPNAHGAAPSAVRARGARRRSTAGVASGGSSLGLGRQAPLPSLHPVAPDAWVPSVKGAGVGSWVTGWPASPWAKIASLQAPAGTTALSGEILQLNGLPLAGVHVSIDGATVSAVSDQTGRFLLSGLPAGHRVLAIGGERAIHGKRYGSYEVGVDLAAGRTTALEETVWLTPLERAGDHRVSSPTRGEVALRTPQIPGLEVRIPAGSVITNAAGKVVHDLNMTAIPVDRAPFPLPAFTNVPIYFTVQPGRAYLSKGAQIIYPNYTHLPAGQRVPFWNYDADHRGWYVYGHGTVSANGKQVIPDPGVRVWELTGAMISGTPPPPGSTPTGSASGGDPVDLYSGLFNYHKTDLVLPDTIPVVIERSYRQGDSNSYSFGGGTASLYDMHLWSENNYHEADLILPNGTRIHYVRTSEGTGFKESEYESTNTPGMFYASTLRWNELENGWDLTLTNGLTYVFGDFAPLQAIRDRFGDQLTITREHGQTGNITQITSPHGRWVTFSYDANNRVTEIKDNGGQTLTYAYTVGGDLEKATDAAARVTKYEYDGSGNMTAITDARGNKYIENKYDANDRVYKQIDGDGGVYEFAYTLNGEGKAESTTVTEPRENKRKITFNAQGLSTKEILGFGSSLEQTINIERQSGTGLVLSATDQRSRKTSYEYDAYGNVTAVTRLAGTSSAQTTRFTYEPQTSELTKITDPLNHATKYEYSTKGELLGITDALGHKTTAEYNASGQPTVIKNALGKKTTLSYQFGDLVSVADQLSHTDKQFMDNLGRVTSVTRPEGQRTTYGYDMDNELTSITGPSGAQTTFEYDADGDPTAVTDPRHNKTTAAYESMDRLESETDPLLHTTRWVYNKAGYPVEATDRKGLLTKASYDTLGRLMKIRFGVSGETAQSSISYEYDNANRLSKIEDSAGGTYTPTFDELDRLTALAGPNGTIEYTYDEANRRKKLIVPGQEAINYTYDEANRLTELARGTQKVKLGYDNANRPTSKKLIDGIEATYGYDEASNMTSTVYKKGTETLGELDYAYNSDGQTEALWGSYARTGLPEAVSTLSYNVDNELTERSTKHLGYDNNGNLTSDGTNEYTWDDRGQLESISGGSTASFAYDPFGRRSLKTLAGTTTKLLYDGPNVVQETVGGTATGNLITGLSPDTIYSRTTSTGTDSYLSNLQKSTVALANSEGAVKTSYTYDPFGSTTSEGTASTNPYQYTGRENDGTSLQYNRARYYNPTNGRFISQDPKGFTGSGANLYQYTLGDPLDFTDPSGRDILGDIEEAGEWAWEHKTQIAEVTGATACVFVSAGTCAGAALVVFSVGTWQNVEDAQQCHGSFGSFVGSELLTTGETIIGGAPGFLLGGTVLKFGEELLPATNIGKWLLNTPPAMTSIGMTNLEPGINSSAGAGGDSEGGGGGGSAGGPGTTPGAGGGPGGAGGGPGASSGEC
jgi:RHS repeat-associated protein